jgi:hypothetical protein
MEVLFMAPAGRGGSCKVFHFEILTGFLGHTVQLKTI